MMLKKWSLLGVVVGVAKHVLAIGLIGIVFSWLFSDTATTRMLLLGKTSYASQAQFVHLMYSTLFWAMCMGVYTWFKRPTERTPRVIRLNRGQVMLETLIVITPFLLLTGGLSQLMINNIAGMLTNLSVYQAGRTCWVWEGELSRNADIGAAASVDLNKRATLAAAAVLAPVAGGPVSTTDPDLDNLLGIMAAHFSDQVTISGPISPPSNPYTAPETFADALDTSPFSQRATYKLKAAHANTMATCAVGGGQITARVTYNHFLAFPWFSYIFEDSSKVGYSIYVREYTIPMQVPTQ